MENPSTPKRSLNLLGPVDIYPFDNAKAFLDPFVTKVYLLGEPSLHGEFTRSFESALSVSCCSVPVDHTFGIFEEFNVGNATGPSDCDILENSWILGNWKDTVASVVLFFDLRNFEQYAWEDVEDKLVSLLLRFRERNPLASRVFNEFVVLVTSSTYLAEAVSFMSNTWRKCNLSSRKDVFFFPIDAPEDTLVKLEHHLRQKITDYFRGRIKNIKRAKDAMTEIVPKMMTRNNVQLALLHRSIGEAEHTLFHMKEATKYYRLIAITESNRFELMNVGFLITFSMIGVLLTSGRFGEVVHLLNEHMIYFDLRDQFPLSFQDLSWKSLQYEIFADLLGMHESPRKSFDRYHHPSFYLHRAVLASKMQRKLSVEALHQWDPKKPNHLYHLLKERLFFGTLYPSGTSREDQLEMALWRESSIDHSQKIVSMLKLGYSSLQKFGSHRTLSLFGKEIADEYFAQGQFELAKSFYENLLQLYRKEKWDMLLSSTLQQLIDCSRQLNNLRETISFGLELLGHDYLDEEAYLVLEDEVVALLVHISDLSTDQLDVFSIPYDSKLLTVSSGFQSSSLCTKSKNVQTLRITSNWSTPLSFSGFKVVSSHSQFDWIGSLDGLVIVGGTESLHEREVEVDVRNPMFTIERIELSIAQFPNCLLVIDLKPSIAYHPSPLVYDFVVDAIYDGPVVLLEYFPIDFSIFVENDASVSARISITLKHQEDTVCELFVYEDDHLTPIKESSAFNARLNNVVLSKKPQRMSLFAKAEKGTLLSILLSICSINGDKLKEHSLQIPISEAFSLDSQLLVEHPLPVLEKAKGDKLYTLCMRTNTRGFLHMRMQNICGHSIQVTRVSVHSEISSIVLTSKLIDLQPLQTFSYMLPLFFREEQTHTVGSIAIQWNRESSLHPIRTMLSLPKVTFVDPKVHLSVSPFPEAFVGQTLPIEILLNNKSMEEQRVSFNIAKHKSFMLIGKMDFSVTLLPLTSEKINIEFVALASGTLQLPALTCVLESTSESLFPLSSLGSVSVFPQCLC